MDQSESNATMTPGRVAWEASEPHLGTGTTWESFGVFTRNRWDSAAVRLIWEVLVPTSFGGNKTDGQRLFEYFHESSGHTGPLPDWNSLDLTKKSGWADGATAVLAPLRRVLSRPAANLSTPTSITGITGAAGPTPYTFPQTTISQPPPAPTSGQLVYEKFWRRFGGITPITGCNMEGWADLPGSWQAYWEWLAGVGGGIGDEVPPLPSYMPRFGAYVYFTLHRHTGAGEKSWKELPESVTNLWDHAANSAIHAYVARIWARAATFLFCAVLAAIAFFVVGSFWFAGQLRLPGH